MCDYDHAFQQVRDDYLLFGRGVCRLRYEPTFKDEINEGEDDDDAAKLAESGCFWMGAEHLAGMMDEMDQTLR